MRLALATINPTVGDIEGNTRLVERAVSEADVCGASLVLLPELAICGYPPKDLIGEHGFVERCERACEELATRLPAGVVTIVGTPLRRHDRATTNSLVVLRDGRVSERYDKRLLPTYDVFDEDRYFEPGTRAVVIDVCGVRCGLTICEDLWQGEDAGFAARYAGAGDPVAECVALGATVILSASASPFVVGKDGRHASILAGHARRHGVVVASVNQSGGNDELIFDGHRHVLGSRGQLLASGARFADDVQPLVWQGGQPASVVPPPGEELQVALALRRGIRDYLAKTGFRGALLGLSGGIDSALTCVLAVAALGADNVTGVSMPGPYSSDHSKSDAHDLAQRLGMRCIDMPLREAFEGMRIGNDRGLAALSKPLLGARLPDIAEENLQSRIRGTMLMTMSNRTGQLVLTTGNKSELAVGYATLYGDMNGGLAVLSDLSKQWVYRLSRFLNREWRSVPGLERLNVPPIPAGSIDKPPSAELRPDQKDQDSLPPYEVLDAILELAIERRLDASEIERRTQGQEGFDNATIARVLRMVRIAEYKRRQAAVGLKVTGVAFGSGRRMPIARA